MKKMNIKRLALAMSGHVMASKRIRPALKMLGLPVPKDKKVSAPSKVKNDSISIPGLEALALHGQAWLAISDQKPVLLFFGVSPWKRDMLAKYFPDFRLAFARKDTPWEKILPALSKLTLHAFVFWGMTEKKVAANYATSKDIPIWRIEDGFLRSVGLGAQHILPLSLAIDEDGIYFDASRPSSLEKLISEIGSTGNAALLERARRCISIISTFGLTKYNVSQELALKSLGRSERKRVLVVGQVEDDASIILGCKTRYTNNDVVRIACKENPDAEVLYRPHPDVMGGHREEFSNPRDVADICTIASTDYDLISLIDSSDHIYTMTSLVGFEALMRGKKVTTLGSPFYSGWGLTDDRQETPRRVGRPSIDELFAASYILYPKYCVGPLGSSAEIEHAIMALALEKAGVPRVLAEGVSGSLPAEAITADFISHAIGSIKGKRFLFDGVEVFADCDAAFFSLVLDPSATVDSLLDHVVALAGNGASDGKIFEKISALLRAGGSGKALGQLRSVSPEKISISDTPHLANCFTLAGMFDEAELLLNRKAGSLNGAIPAADLLPLLNAYEFVRAAQGKFGRKPVDSGPLWSFFRANLQWLRRDPNFLVVLPHIFAHLSHFRMIDEMRWLADELLSAFGEDDIIKLTKVSESIVSSLLRASKRPELVVQEKRHLAITIYRNTEAKITAYYESQGAGIPRSASMLILQMAVAVDDKGGIKSYKKIVFDGDSPVSKGDMSEYKKTVSNYFNMLIKANDYSGSREFIEAQKGKIPEEFYMHLLSSNYTYERDYPSAGKVARALLKKYKKNSYRRKIATVHANSGELEKASAWLNQALTVALQAGGSSGRELSAIREDLARVNFLSQASDILESVAQPKLPKGVVFLGSFGCLNTVAMVVPVLVELKRRGYAVVQLDEGMLRNEPTGVEWIDKHAGMIERVIHSDRDISTALVNEWRIDWAGRAVVADGINFYQAIFEIMTQKFRAFNFDINDPWIFRWFRYYLIRCDKALTACKSIQREVMARGMPVRFINAGSHSAPFSVYRSFALHHASQHDVGFVHMGPAYENYYSNLKSKVATTVSLENLTKYPLYRLPFLARPDLFESWLTQDGLYDRYREDIEIFLNHNRVGRIGDNSNASEYEEKLRAAKAADRKIIGVYGKILCDLAVPFDGGPGHEHIVDWLRHTVSIAKSTSNLIVLKPHPHELRPEIARDLNEYWLDVISDMDIPENVMILPHTGFNNQDLIKYLDLAVLWNGTSSLELCAQGVPVVMASHFGRHDYPVELIYPKSREDYEDIIRASSWERPDRSKMERAALLLKYMGTDEVCVPFKYSHRPVTNDPVGVPYWHMDEVDRFLRNGDPHISRLADKFFA